MTWHGMIRKHPLPFLPRAGDPVCKTVGTGLAHAQFDHTPGNVPNVVQHVLLAPPLGQMVKVKVGESNEVGVAGVRLGAA